MLSNTHTVVICAIIDITTHFASKNSMGDSKILPSALFFVYAIVNLSAFDLLTGEIKTKSQKE